MYQFHIKDGGERSLCSNLYFSIHDLMIYFYCSLVLLIYNLLINLILFKDHL